MTQLLPGTLRHQQMLQTIINFYADDNRILAILLFGSLGRGNWDTYSDLDMDIILRDDVPIDAIAELHNLCVGIKQKHGCEALIIADHEEGDVVLSNLIEFSIRYHTLATTKPAILDTMQLLAGTLTLEAIREAGESNRRENTPDLSEIVNQCIRYTLELENAIARQRLWMALEFLYRTRTLLMQLFTATRHEIRPIHTFEAYAEPDLRAALAGILPRPEIPAIKDDLHVLIYLLETDLPAFSHGQYQLSIPQRKILQQIKHNAQNI